MGAIEGFVVGIASNVAYDLIKKLSRIEIFKQIPIRTSFSLVINFREGIEVIEIDNNLTKTFREEFGIKKDQKKVPFIEIDNLKLYVLIDYHYLEDSEKIIDALNDIFEIREEDAVQPEFIDALTIQIFPDDTKELDDILMVMDVLKDIKRLIQRDYNIEKDLIWLRLDVDDEKSAILIQKKLVESFPELIIIKNKDMQNNVFLKIKDTSDLELKQIIDVLKSNRIRKILHI